MEKLHSRISSMLALAVVLLALISGTESRRARAVVNAAPEPEVTRLNKKQAVALHHAVKKLLGFKDSPKKMEEGGERRHLGSRGGHLGLTTGSGLLYGRKSNSAQAPPQYMLDLYDKYKFQAIAHGRQTGNTARYINGHLGSVNGEHMFFFNLTTVGRTERVFSADLHVHQRRSKSKSTEYFAVLHKVAPPHTLTEVASVHIKSRESGWTETDVTSAVKRCLHQDRKSAMMDADVLALSFRRKKKGKKSRPVPLTRFGDENSMPFLVLFSNDTQNITLDHVDPHFRPSDLMEEIIDPEFGYDPTLVNGRYQPKKVFYDEDEDDYEYPEVHPEDDEDVEELEDEDSEDDTGFEIEIGGDILPVDGYDDEEELSPNLDGEQIDQNIPETDFIEPEEEETATPAPSETNPDQGDNQRIRRSIFDNEIPEDPVRDIRPKTPFNVPVPDSGPSSFPSRGTVSTHKVKVKGKGKGKVIPSSDLELEVRPQKNNRPERKHKNHKKENHNKDADLIPYPEDFLDRRNRKNRRRNRRRNRNKHRRGGGGAGGQGRSHNQERQLPFPPSWEAEMRKESMRSDRKSLCARRKLVVNFADIAWDDWVISPKSFDAYYCAGQCPFPLTTDVRPSNHATIQSLVHVIGLPADVPAPCCVPDELSSVSLLYFDGNDNVVLKHYPSMSVTSCACR